MRRLLLGVLLCLGLLLATIQYASESGEVVILEVADATGTVEAIRLWVVDHDGTPWLRAGTEASNWFQSLLASDSVAVTRDNLRRHYQAIVDTRARDTINEQMQSKYGWRETFIGGIFGGRSEAMPIRLEPLQ